MKLPIEPAVKRSLLAGAMLAALGACGGGGDGGGGSVTAPAAPTQTSASVPASAVASTSAFVSYLKALPRNETEEPLSVTAVTPPTTDTDEPTSV